MFLLPAMVTLSIAATRIYRSLADHASVVGTEQYDITPFIFLSVDCNWCCRISDHVSLQFEGSGRMEYKTNRVPITPTLLSRVEVAINSTYEQDQTLQTC
jgi:hypothetical protein